MRHPLVLFAVIVAACAVSRLEAGMISLDAVGSGNYNSLGGANLNSYAVGRPSGLLELHNFFVFDLSSITDTIISAELRVDGGTVGGLPLVRLFDVTPGNINDLLAGTAGTSLYGDLGTGVVFGEGPAPSNTLVTFTLNGDAISNLNASAGSVWAIGGARGDNTVSFAFGGLSGDEARQLVLTTDSQAVPEPASLTLLAIGAFSLLGCGRRQT